jgi:hypothetical protein
MAINGVSGGVQFVPQQTNVRQAKVGRDADGDNDGTKAGQAEQAKEAGKLTEAKAKTIKPAEQAAAPDTKLESKQPSTQASGTTGRNINVFA